MFVVRRPLRRWPRFRALGTRPDATRPLGERAPMTAEERGREHVFGTIPNVLTMVRLVSTGPLAWLIVTGEYKAACGVFVVSGALDWADGFIARRWPSQASVLGSFLDPVADKVLVAGTTLALTSAGLLSPWVTGVIVARDVGLVAAGFVLRALTRTSSDEPFFSTTHASSFQVTPSTLSKANTALQLALVTSALANAAWAGPPLVGSAIDALGIVVATTTVASWWGYYRSPSMQRIRDQWK